MYRGCSVSLDNRGVKLPLSLIVRPISSCWWLCPSKNQSLLFRDHSVTWRKEEHFVHLCTYVPSLSYLKLMPKQVLLRSLSVRQIDFLSSVAINCAQWKSLSSQQYIFTPTQRYLDAVLGQSHHCAPKTLISQHHQNSK
ncbi:hypothetical protein KC19_8G092100 [Ceratodon purpureus]|uniref:Uncharacterized protein n=1 Tax=Ceratodon purpureus TaxID=3225 RepID=A0A8T0GWZ4_CERPU|nr:hypothetical protein KC19_8G092100 [Ceratodon purpureus]